MKFLNLTYSRLLMILLAAVAVGLAGCGDDEEEELKPVITVDAVTVADGATLAPGEDANLSVVIRKGADGKNLESVQIKQYVNSSQTGVTLYENPDVNSETFNWDTTMTAAIIDNATTQYRWEIVAADRDNNLETRNISFTVEAEGDTTDPQPEKPKVITASFTNENAFMATSQSSPSTMNLTAADGMKGSIDLTYIYSQNFNTYSFVSPVARTNADLYGDNAISGYTNNTRFYTVGISPDRFAELKDLDKSEIKNVVDSGTLAEWPNNGAGDRVGGEAPSGDVYGFKLNDRYGLIRVQSVVTDQMTVEIITND